MDRVPDYPDDVTVYLVVNDIGKLGKAYVETDITEADRETIIRNFISGQSVQQVDSTQKKRA